MPAGAQPLAIGSIPEIDGVHLGIATRERLVIRDKSTWEATWLQIVESNRPIPPTPEVDFENELIIVAAMGTRNTGGFTIDIEEVHTMDGDAWITVREQSPGRTCFVITALTAPVDIALVPRFDGDATFVERTSQHDCR